MNLKCHCCVDMSFYTSRQSDFETSCEDEFVELSVTVLIRPVYLFTFIYLSFFFFFDILRNILTFCFSLSLVSHYVHHRHIGQYPNDSYIEANSGIQNRFH